MARRCHAARTFCPINVAWLRLKMGTLKVNLRTSEVYSLRQSGEWESVSFHETQPRWQHQGGYYSAKLRITIDGVRYRQNCFLHRIVWMAKHKLELTDGFEIDHLDGKACNHWTNLERLTTEEHQQRTAERSACGEYANVPF